MNWNMKLYHWLVVLPLLVYIGMNNKTVFLSISVKTLHTGEVKLHAVKTELRKQ